MTTNLNFDSGSTTETLPGGTDYNISQDAPYPVVYGSNTNVTLGFTLPVTIDNDTVNGDGNHEYAGQTLNFSIMNLTGTLSTGYNDSVTLNGDILNNNGTIRVGSEPEVGVTINTKLLGGTGMEFIDGSMTVNGMVGGGQTFDVGGNLTIGDPGQFFGHVNMQEGLVDLVGLAATSYDYSNDVLTLWNGNRPVDRLNITGSGLGVYQNSGLSAGVLVSNNAYWDNGHTALPVHSVGT